MGIRIFFKGLKSGQKKFGECTASVVNSLLLSFVYFFGIGLTFIFAKIFNKHFLDLNLDKSRVSYWEELNLNKERIEKYYKQF